MKPHTVEAYQNWRHFNERAREGAEPELFEFAGTIVEYTTVHIPETQRPFDFAVAASLPEGQDNYEIAVSDDVPEDLRGLWAWHEYNDFKVVGFDVGNRCRQSEQVVAENLAGTELYQKYLEYRIPFYQSLARFMARDVYAKGDASEYDILDVQGCYSAMDFLDAMASLRN